MGVVYYGNYFIYFEIGRVEFCRAIGLHCEQMEKQTECFMTVAEAGCRYQRPLTYDSLFLVRTTLETFRTALLSFRYEVVYRAEGRLYSRSWTKHIVTGPDGRPRKIPGLCGPVEGCCVGTLIVARNTAPRGRGCATVWEP